MFTDGVPLTAEDVAFTINGIVNGEAAEADLSMVDEARAVDATTCEIAMKRPNNALLYTLAVMGIVPAHAYGPDYGEHPIGRRPLYAGAMGSRPAGDPARQPRLLR